MSTARNPADLSPARYYEMAMNATSPAHAAAWATLALAAEQRTANLIAFKVAQQTALAQCTDDYVAPIKERLGLTQ